MTRHGSTETVERTVLVPDDYLARVGNVAEGLRAAGLRVSAMQ
ncbi:MAG: hypothetical protein ACYC2G_03220 [Gemmatimonadaceae bacterium]